MSEGRFYYEIGSIVQALEKKKKAKTISPLLEKIYTDYLVVTVSVLQTYLEEKGSEHPIWTQWMKNEEGGSALLVGEWLAIIEETPALLLCETCGIEVPRLPDKTKDTEENRRKVHEVETPSATHFYRSVPGIERFDTVSKLYRYFGMDVESTSDHIGEPGNSVRNLQGHFHYMKPTLWKIVWLFIMKSNPFWTQLYNEKKVYYTARYKDTQKGWKAHADKAARRWVAKEIMRIMWEMARESAGFSVRPPYHVEKLGHAAVKPPARVPSQ